jgi:hypothetical protein
MRFHDKQRCGIQVCCIILPPTWMIMEPASQAVNRSKVPLHSEVWARSPVEEDVYRVRPEFSNLRLVSDLLVVPSTTALAAALRSGLAGSSSQGSSGCVHWIGSWIGSTGHRPGRPDSFLFIDLGCLSVSLIWSGLWGGFLGSPVAW